MNWKTFVADYLTFSKKDRIALFLFVAIILIVYALGFMFSRPKTATMPEDRALARKLDSAINQTKQTKRARSETGADDAYEDSKNSPSVGALFTFDPNTLDVAGWKRLGLREKTANTILNYRNKGGHFYKAEDVKKIWGLPADFYDRVQEYIVIGEAKKEDAPNTNFFKTPYAKTSRAITVIDINTSDTTAFIALPGIGSKLAQRIVAFRNKLGGFYTVNQIGETYGLPDSTFQSLKPYLQAHGDLKKFDLNTVTKDALKTHPYLKWNLANAIVEYRTQHGPFKKLDELKNIVLIDDETFNRIVPYFSL